MANKRLLISLGVGIPSIFGIARKPGSVRVDSITTSFSDLKFELKSLDLLGEEFMKDSGSNKSLSNLLKDYLKTLTGAKDFAKLLTSSFLVEFIDDLSDNKASSLKDKLKSELSLIRSDSSVDKLSSNLRNEKLRDFGYDEQSYKDYHTLQQIRGKFLGVISQFFKNSISSSKDSLNNTSNSDEALKSLGGFLDYALDDYIKFEKPLFVRKITWKYDTSSTRKDEIKRLFGEEKLPLGFEVPNKGSYFFPMFSNETEQKFSDFIGSLSTSTSNYESYSDVAQTNYVFSVVEAANPSNTSQFSVALLELFAHALTYSKWSNTGTGTKQSNLSQQAQQEDATICVQNQDAQSKGIPSLKVDSLKDKSNQRLSKIFCVNKDKLPYKSQKPLSDFFYLKKNQNQNKAENWIVFKDLDGVHAMSVDLSVESKNVKKKLLEIANGARGVNGYEWDFSNLSKHIEKHFSRLFLQKWNLLYKKLSTQSSTQISENDDESCWYQLVNLLKADAFSDLIKKLRTNLLKDYLALLDKKPVKVGEDIKSFNPSLGWAGAFPYKMFEKNLQDQVQDQKWKEGEMVFDFLETTFLSEYEELSGSTLSIEKEYKKTVKETMDKYKEGIDNFFKLFVDPLGQDKKSKEGNDYFFFPKNSDRSKIKTDGLKYLTPHKFMQNLWTVLIQENKVLDLLIQDRLKDKLGIYTWQESKREWNENGSVSGFDKSLFDEASDEVTKTVIRQYLWQKHLDKFVSSLHPLIFGSVKSQEADITKADITKADKAIEMLKSFEIHDNVVTSSIREDLIHPSNRDLFYELLAIKYLSENSLDRLRLHLKNKISKDDFSAFVFSRKWSEGSFCEILEDKPSNSSESVFEYKAEYAWELKNRFLGYDDKDFKDFKKCVPKEELFNFAKAKLPTQEGTKGNSFKNLVGYKGLVSSDIGNFFPEEIVTELASKNVLWKNVESLLNYVDAINSEDKYKELVEKLKKLFPSVDWSVAEQEKLLENRNFNFSWDSDSAIEIYDDSVRLSLQDKKRILKGYLVQNDINSFNTHWSSEYLRSVQEKFLTQEIKRNSWLLSENKFTSFYNLATDKGGSHILVDSKNNKYVIFLIQIKYDDLVDVNSWKSYMKTVSDDLIIKELVKASKDKSVQQEAIYHYLNETSGADKINKFTFHDSRLKRQFDVQWQN